MRTMGKYTPFPLRHFFISAINNRFGTLVGLAGGVHVAGELLISVGRLGIVATELCSQAATPATAPLVVLPEARAVSTKFKSDLQSVYPNYFL